MENLKTFENFINENQEVSVNEGNYSYSPNIEKEILKELKPLINAYGINVVEIFPGPDGNSPVIRAEYYQLFISTNSLHNNFGNFAGNFFNRKDATFAKNFFAKNEIVTIMEERKSGKKSYIEKTSNIKLLYLKDLIVLANKRKLNINFDIIKEKDKEWRSLQ